MKELLKLTDKAKRRLKIQYDSDGVKFIEGFIEQNKVQFLKAIGKKIKPLLLIFSCYFETKLQPSILVYQECSNASTTITNNR